nr:hypothetical protein [Tanacetum cinerariifolium]
FANAARNYKFLHERDDDDAEQPDKRQKSDDRHQPTTQQSSHRNHGVPVMGVTRETGVSSPTDLLILLSSSPGVPLKATPTRSALRVDTDTQESVVELLVPASSFQQSRGPSEGYSYPVCTTCGHRHPGECRRAAGTCFKCGQTGHLQKDCKKNTTASTSGQADKKPGASGRVFAITEDHATKTSDHFRFASKYLTVSWL